MEDQPTPTVTKEDVERIVRRDFRDSDEADVMRILERYGPREWHRERERVHLAALKLADGSIKSLECQIEHACRDYRDIIAAAEYPEAMSQWPETDLKREQQSAIYEADWAQYERWFAGG